MARKSVKVRKPPAVTAESLLSLSTPSVVEGDSGTVTLRFVLSRAADGYGPIAYSARTTTAGTATENTDFRAYAFAGTINSGGSVNLDVVVISDVDEEDDETVQMQVTASWP
jgi:hypothetical protein